MTSSSKKVAILQSNYIPWKGYFDIISRVDTFIFYDDLQYTKGDWRNRNKILTPNGPQWLSVPCGSNLNRLICEVEIKEHGWQKKHWKTIEQNYSKAPYFSKYSDFFKSFYLDYKWDNLSEMNQFLIHKIAKELLLLNTQFEDSRKYHLKEKKSERVVELLLKSEATHYLSGPSAKNYLNEADFKKHNIRLEYIDYSHYKPYPQTHSNFEPNLTILDLLFNVGLEYKSYI